MMMKICEVVKNLNATTEDLKYTALNLGSLNTKGKKMRLEMTEYQIKETLKLVQNIIGDLENAED